MVGLERCEWTDVEYKEDGSIKKVNRCEEMVPHSPRPVRERYGGMHLCEGHKQVYRSQHPKEFPEVVEE